MSKVCSYSTAAGAIALFFMPLATGGSRVPVTVYVRGETASGAGDFDTAVRSEFASFELSETQVVRSVADRTIALVPDELTFGVLVDSWRKECGVSSSTREITTTESYLKIIGMGSSALPLIFRQLEAEDGEPDHWFAALRAITRENPVPVEARGNLRMMAAAWLSWAARNGYAGKLDA